MEIAVLAWGSLVWQPANDHGELSVRTGSRWAEDGPMLPVEFARISSDGRLTLVVLPGYRHQSAVLWRPSGLDDLDEAIDNLARRETRAPRSAIHAVAAGEKRGDVDSDVAERVQRWLDARPGIDAAIWTGLQPGDRWQDAGHDRFTPDAAIAYFRSLRGPTRDRAVEYVRNAPEQIDTPVRRALASLLAG